MISFETTKYYGKSAITHAIATRSAAPLTAAMAQLTLRADPIVTADVALTIVQDFLPGCKEMPLSYVGSSKSAVPTEPTAYAASVSRLVEQMIEAGSFTPDLAFPRFEGIPVAIPFPIDLSTMTKAGTKGNIMDEEKIFKDQPTSRLSFLLETFFTSRGELHYSMPLSSDSVLNGGQKFMHRRKRIKSMLEKMSACEVDGYTLSNLAAYMPLSLPDGRYVVSTGIGPWLERCFNSLPTATSFYAWRVYLAFHAREILASAYFRDTIDERDLPNSMKGWSTRFQRLGRVMSLPVPYYWSYLAAIMHRYKFILKMPGVDDALRAVWGPLYDERMGVIKTVLDKVKLLPHDAEMVNASGACALDTNAGPATCVYLMAPQDYETFYAPFESFTLSKASEGLPVLGSKGMEAVWDKLRKRIVEMDLEKTAVELALTPEDEEPDLDFSATAGGESFSSLVNHPDMRAATQLLERSFLMDGVAGPTAVATIMYHAARGIISMRKYLDDNVHNARIDDLCAAAGASASPTQSCDDHLTPIFTDGDRISKAQLTLSDIAFSAFLPVATATDKVLTGAWMAFPSLMPLFPLAADPSRISFYSDALASSLKDWPTALHFTPVLATPGSDYSFAGRDPRLLRGSNAYEGQPSYCPIAYSILQLLNMMEMSSLAFQRAYAADPESWVGNHLSVVDPSKDDDWKRSAGVLIPKWKEAREALEKKGVAARTMNALLVINTLAAESSSFSPDEFLALFEINGNWAYEIAELRPFNTAALFFSRLPTNYELHYYINLTPAPRTFYSARDSGANVIVRVDREVPNAPYAVQDSLELLGQILSGDTKARISQTALVNDKAVKI